jgi:hypothetical protein
MALLSSSGVSLRASSLIARYSRRTISVGFGEIFMRIVVLVCLAISLAGCSTAETVQFHASSQQQALMRDGAAALVSRQKNSIVLVRPAGRQIASGSRPVFVVGIYNLTKQPLDFRVADVEISQVYNGQSIPMGVVTYEALAQEESNRQVATAIFTGLAAVGNAYSASQAGYGSFRSTSSGSGGSITTTGTYYNPAAAAVAQRNASIQNEEMISSTIERGQANMAALERTVIKDNTLLPGEWYGGQLYLSPPANPPSGNQKSYSISLLVGGERHLIDVAQEPAR